MQRRIQELDGIRGCAILLVIAHHYVADQILAPAPGSLGAATLASVRFSWSGVDLFFVLSGFLIARVLVRNRQAVNYFGVFYLRRACRILPLYVVLLATYYIAIMTGVAALPGLGWLFSNPMPDYSYLTFTQNILMGWRESWGAAWLIPTWSLAVEEQFYLVVPALVLLSRRRLAGVAAVAFLAAPLLRYAYPGFHTYVVSVFRADTLAAGILLALAFESHVVRAWLRNNVATIKAAFAAMLTITVGLTYLPWRGALEFTWLALLYSLLIAVTLLDAESAAARIARWRPLRWLGNRSYGLYLFHLPVLGLVQGFRGHATPEIVGLADILATLGALALSVLIAATSYRLIEAPFIELGQRVRYRIEIDATDEASTASA